MPTSATVMRDGGSGSYVSQPTAAGFVRGPVTAKQPVVNRAWLMAFSVKHPTWAGLLAS